MVQTDQWNSNIQKFLCYLAYQEIVCAGASSVDGILLISNLVGICLQLPWRPLWMPKELQIITSHLIFKDHPLLFY